MSRIPRLRSLLKETLRDIVNNHTLKGDLIWKRGDRLWGQKALLR